MKNYSGKAFSQISRSEFFLTKFFVLTFVVGIFGVAAVLGQGYQAQYSDQWGNDYNEETFQVVGAGITENNYASFGFTYGIQTTLTDPNNNNWLTTSSWGSTYARAEVFTIWNGIFGNWVVYSTHTTWNWYQNWMYSTGSTSYNSGAGLVGEDIQIFQLDPAAGPTGRIDPDKCRYEVCGWSANGVCFYNVTVWDPWHRTYNDGGGVSQCRVGLWERWEEVEFLWGIRCVRVDQHQTDKYCHEW